MRLILVAAVLLCLAGITVFGTAVVITAAQEQPAASPGECTKNDCCEKCKCGCWFAAPNTNPCCCEK